MSELNDLRTLLKSYEKALADNETYLPKLRKELSEPQDQNRRATLRYAITETEAVNLDLEIAISATRAQIQSLEGGN